jgi:2-oxoisovalerate dehydrogenase E2 component (dihydrolipoyl transacylase)
VSNYIFKLPDLGEGTVQAEIVGWRVKPGDMVTEDEVIVEVMTEKAAVEVPAPVSGRVVSITGAPGDMVPVGAQLLVVDTTGAAAPAAAAAPPPLPLAAAPAGRPAGANGAAGHGVIAPAVARAGRIATSPATRRRAHEAGVDLQQVAGSGPNGRIVPRTSRHTLPQDPVPRRPCAPRHGRPPRAAAPRAGRPRRSR